MPGEFSAYLVATLLVTLMFAFYGRVMPFGALGYVGGALAGFVWSLVAGAVSSWLSQDATIAALSADAVLFACIIVAGSLVGGGVLYLQLSDLAATSFASSTTCCTKLWLVRLTRSSRAALCNRTVNCKSQ